jgi:serine/threonine-protein kinase
MSTVPPLTGLGQDAATTAITGAGLQLGSITPQNDKDLAAGTVISSDPADGASVPTGTLVNLVVASGRVAINDVRGYTVDAATRELEAVGLTVIPQEDPGCAASDPPTVKSQSLTPGDVPVHSEIALIFCTGS